MRDANAQTINLGATAWLCVRAGAELCDRKRHGEPRLADPAVGV